MITVQTIPEHTKLQADPVPCPGCGLPVVNKFTIEDAPARERWIAEATKVLPPETAETPFEFNEAALRKAAMRFVGVSFQLCGECTWKLCSASMLFAKHWEANRPKPPRRGKRRK